MKRPALSLIVFSAVIGSAGIVALAGTASWEAASGLSAGRQTADASRRAEAGSEDHHGHGPDVGDHYHAHAPDGSTEVVLATRPEGLRAGERVELSFALIDAAGRPVSDLVAHHGRKLHVVIVSEDMHLLGHVHPQDFGEPVGDGVAKAFFTFPRAGRYLIAVDFLTAEGKQAAHFVVEVAGKRAEGAAEATAAPNLVTRKLEEDDRYTKAISLLDANAGGGYSVSLQRSESVESGTPASFVYRLSKNGAPLTDLRPYLDAPLHLAVVKEDLTVFLHEHGTPGGVEHASHDDGAHGHEGHAGHHQTPAAFGPELTATISFPEPGTYYLFVQAAHHDTLIVSRVPVQVR